MRLVKDEGKLSKLKKVGIVFLSGIIIFTVMRDYNNFADFKNDLKVALLSSLMGITYDVPLDSTHLNNIDLKEDTLYIHDNGKRQIISENQSIAGYENEGVYIPSDKDTIAYVSTTTGYGYESSYFTASNNEINNKYDYIDDDFAIIDENSPEELSVDIPNTK